MNLKKLGLSEIDENGFVFKTGYSVIFPYLHNTEKTPYLGEAFGQDIEPAGFYAVLKSHGFTPELPWISGVISFENPLVLSLVTPEDLQNNKYESIYGEKGWKKRLSNFFKKTGKKLSKALMDKGFDGIVTVDESTKSVSEIIVLKKECLNKTITLDDIYDGDALYNVPPTEILYDYLSDKNVSMPIALDFLFPESLSQLETYMGDMTVIEAYEEFADEEQRELVDDYREDPDKETPIVTYGKTLLDGYHRCVAAILNKQPILVVDIDIDI